MLLKILAQQPMSPDWNPLIQRAEALMTRLEALLAPHDLPAPDWQAAHAFRLRQHRNGSGLLAPVWHLSGLKLDALLEVDVQKDRLVRNTAQFVQGKPANNVLLTGARGTGKSSLVKAVLQAFAPQGLRLIELDKADLLELPRILDLVAHRPERFIVFCDDLSFQEGEPGYAALKSVLEGSVVDSGNKLLIYATSNRRHLVPETYGDNLKTQMGHHGEIHPGEAVEEKISLSDRFGLWISFYPFDQNQYLSIVEHWLRHLGVAESALAPARAESLVWALERGSRTGRVAQQFAKDFAGRMDL
jgi:uncharacterized protein